MHDLERNTYAYESLTESLYIIFNMKEHDKKNIVNYTKIFKQTSDVLKYRVGPDTLDKIF